MGGDISFLSVIEGRCGLREICAALLFKGEKSNQMEKKRNNTTFLFHFHAALLEQQTQQP
jgi:hypothetical protein